MKMDGRIVSKYKKTQKFVINSSGVLVILFALLASCSKDPDNLGRDLLPSSDSLFVKIDSSTFIKSYSITGKRILSSANEFYILGSMRDSIFGDSKAGLLTRYHPTLLISADSIRNVDSLILYLAPSGFYGDSLFPMTLHVFELNDTMQVDSNYFSDINPLEYYDPAIELASYNYTANDTLLRIKITDSAILDKFETMPDSIFKDKDDFEDKFYGLYLSVDQVNEKGSYSYFNLANSDNRLTMYYNGHLVGDTMDISYAYEMAFTSIVAKANVFTHNYTGFPVASNLDLAEAGDTSMYVEGLAGVSGRLSFPQLDDWRNKGLISINKAELILPVDSMVFPALSKDDYPSNLLLFSVGEDEEYDYLYDYRIDNASKYFDGAYHADINSYVFNIGFHLQSFINHKIENMDFVVVNRQSNSSARRVILKGATAEKSPVILKVTYTELY